MHTNSKVDVLKKRIASQSRLILDNNVLFRKLRNTSPTKLETSQYILNCHYLIMFTQPNLRSALNSSIEINNKLLAEYFLCKIFEEIGHEKWAEEDLINNKSKLTPGKDQATPSMKELVKYLTSISIGSPIQYAAYVLVAEYTLAEFGNEILQLFRSTKKDSTHMSVISKHVELDVAHAHDDETKLNIILDNCSDKDFSEMLLTIDRSLNLLDRSITEITYVDSKENNNFTLNIAK